MEALLKINPNAIEIMEKKLKYFSKDDGKDKIKEALFHSIENHKNLKTNKLAGNDLIESLLKNTIFLNH